MPKSRAPPALPRHRADAIAAMTDPRKLQRLEQYLREEGYEPTAGHARKRLRELGAAAQPARADDQARRLLEDEIRSFVGIVQVRRAAIASRGRRAAVKATS
jgi:hypothetical protein